VADPAAATVFGPDEAAGGVPAEAGTGYFRTLDAAEEDHDSDADE
jgi:hypothetical protein